MCVIILRHPGISIPFEKIQSACVVNPDGWGFAIADRGKLTYRHGLDKATDPEVIQKILEDAKDQSLMLHLRYVTQGKRNLENCHPFETLKKDEHGIDVAFCHNGTLSEWKEADSDYSDSYWLNQKLISPLMMRSAAFVGPDNCLRDDFVTALLEETAGYSSLFGIIDGNGLQLAINHSRGKEFNGWWASNEYSFNERHRTPATTDYPTAPWMDADYDQFSNTNTTDTTGTGSCITPEKGKVLCYIGGTPHYIHKTDTGSEYVPVVPEDHGEELDIDLTDEDEEEIEREEELLEQGEKIKETLDNMKTKRMNPKLIKHCLEKKYPSFIEIAKIDDLREMTRFDPEDINELATYYPEAAGVLIKDLLAELYFKGIAAKRQTIATAAVNNIISRNQKAAS